MITAEEALQRLKDGNKRFIQNASTADASATQACRDELVAGQKPIAIILGCSDSRVPAEFVFDQSFGDLFVVRVAGNVAAPTQMGSIEFAAVSFGIPLVVVLGHSGCGAVVATVNELEQPASDSLPNIHSIVERIKPAVSTLMDTPLKEDKAALIAQAIRENVNHSADHLRHGSPLLKQLIADEKLTVVGAEYSLSTGVVEFFDENESSSLL